MLRLSLILLLSWLFILAPFIWFFYFRKEPMNTFAKAWAIFITSIASFIVIGYIISALTHGVGMHRP
jgi:hypothetical protein